MLVTIMNEGHVREFHDHTGLQMLIASSSLKLDPQIGLVVIKKEIGILYIVDIEYAGCRKPYRPWHVLVRSSGYYLCSAEHMHATEVGLTTLASTNDSKSA